MTMGSLRQMLRFVSPEECQSLQDICEYNDISEEQLVSAPEKIYSIEMFMHNLPRICCMSFFPNLVSLSLIQQGIACIEGLYCCQSLEILRLSENKIQRIEGLQSCLKLKELYLHSNRITHIKNLSQLIDLQVLWLANNEISWVEGMESLVNLKELSLARNPIGQLGEILEMKSLECLNVAATNMGSFKEIGHLTRLKNLKELRFSDPHWGDSPLSLLHNYQTYVLFRLRHLQKLDTLGLTEEAKQAAKAIYTRKRVYYNMCIKSLQHSRNNAVANVVKAESKRIRSIQKTLAKLTKTLRDLEKEMYEAIKAELAPKVTKKQEAAPKAEWWEQAFAKASTVDKQIQHLMGRLDYFVEDMQMTKAKEQAAVDLNIHWLMMELDTGGNIRMEVGKPKDPWFKNCEELVVSRFLASDFAPYGIVGVSVVKVTRIHNRFLQDRLTQTLENIRPGKRVTEHLLYGESLQAPDEIQWIIEEGFPFQPDQLCPRASESAVSLSNSIGLADIHRLKTLPKQFQHTTFWKSRATGWLLVVKACLGTSIQDLNDSATVKKAAFPSADSVYRLHPRDSKQKSWFVFDSTVLVPEYLVEFKYKFGTDVGEPQKSARPSETEIDPLVSERSRGPEEESQSLSDQPPFDSLLTIPQANPSDFRSWVVETCTSQGRDEKGVLLKDEYIMRRNFVKDVSKITHLNLHGGNIMGIESLRTLTSLRVLVLSFNKITKIHGLEQLQFLQRLDLSFNLLKRVDGLSGQSNLEVLDLTGNEIWNPDDLAVLQRQVPRLVNLNLRSNPLVEEFGYRTMVSRAVPSLKTLDCIPVTPEDPDDGLSKSNSTPENVMSSSISQWSAMPPSPPSSQLVGDKGPKSDDFKGIMSVKCTAENACRRQSHVRLNPYTKLLRLDILNPFTKLFKGLQNQATALKEDCIFYEGVEEVHLEHRRLRTMHCFDRLPNLRRLFLSGNEISVIQGLENCTMLEELILDDNRIKQVKGLSQLQCLWRLDLGRNQLTSCIPISSCASLTQLSVEDNNISSLEGLASLSCLMELYAAQNQLSDIREIYHIRDLPKLMVMDLTGNTLCRANDYRTYTIFSLRKLKVLDGKNVDNSELAEARNKYLGRLTRDVLEECLGHSQFSHMKKMDLSSQSLRHCGDVFRMKELQGLMELNLNNNLFTSLQGLRYLRKLAILRLDNNKFENGPIVEESPPSLASDGRNSVMEYSEPPSMEVEVLELAGNNISSITSLCLGQTFPKLKLLSLQYNRIAKVDGLEGMGKLEKLLIGHNNIKELDPSSFIGLTSLKNLHMGDNTLRTLAHIGNLPSLQTLDVSSNFLTSNRFGCLSSIDNLAFLPGLIELTLTNNPMTRQHLYRTAVISKLTQLKVLDAKEITQEERLEAEQFLAGKEGPASTSDMNSMLDHQSSNGHVGMHNGQNKVPLKVTSLDFEAMCTQILPPSPQNLGYLSGAKGLHVGTTVTQNGQIGPPKPWEPGDVKQTSSHLIQSYFRSRLRGEQKVIVLPLDVLMIRNSNAKDRTISMYETCAKQQPQQQ